MGQTVQAPQRTLGTFETACIVIGAIVGVGIFFSPRGVAKVAGSPSSALLAWVVAGAIALCGALAFAELGRRRNGPGGQYEILRDAYGKAGPLAGFVFVFCNATGVQAGSTAIIAFICAKNILAALHGTADGLAPGVVTGLAAALIVSVTVANIIGVKFGAAIQSVTVIAKILALSGVVALAATIGPARFHEPATTASVVASPFWGVLAGLVPAFFAYGGWQHALWISGEVKNPKRTLPIAILVGTAIVVVVYISANWAYLSLLGYDRVVASEALAADAVGTVYPDTGARAVAGAVAISAFGVLNAQLLSGPRLVQALGADERYLRFFAWIHPRFGTPVAAILLLGVAALSLVLAFGDKELVIAVVVLDGLFFFLTAAAIFRLPKAEGGSLPGSAVAAVLFMIGVVGIVVGAHQTQESREAAMTAFKWMGASVLLYLFVLRYGNIPRGGGSRSA